MDFVSVVIVNWNSKLFLSKCIDSVLNQSYNNLEIIFIDNGSTDGSFEFVNEKYKDRNNIIKVQNINSGYAGGANKGIQLAKGMYVAILNPDIILQENYVKKCIETFHKDEKVAAVSGKLLKYDFRKNKKLNIIDSAGINVTRSRKCYDRGQNDSDNGQFNKIERVFAVCGAAAFFKKADLENCKIENQYFDEDFFSYKEDIDLCWRLNLYGHKCMYTPYAVAYHGRGMNGANGLFNFIKNRRKQSGFLRQLSFRNHYCMLLKNETQVSYDQDKLKIIFRLMIYLVYSLFFERFNFKVLKEIYKSRRTILKKRKVIMTKCSIEQNELLGLFSDR